MLAADYSSALTILLRYPNSAPYRPVTFVRDALYLRDHLDPAGGNHIISRYSGRVPTSQRAHLGRSSVFPSRSRRRRSPIAADGGPAAIGPRAIGPRIKPPLPSPASYLRRRQAIDILLHDAAQAVYQQGERWGVNQAVRDAVVEVKKNMSGLQQQSGTLSSLSSSSLDEATYTTTSNSVETQEQQQRDRVLAEILDDALNDLRTMRSNHKILSSAGPSPALEAALTKISLVKERLVNVSRPLEKGDQEEGSKVSSGPMVNGDGSGKPRSSMSEIGQASSTREGGASRRTSEEFIPSPCSTPSTNTTNNNNNSTPSANHARGGPITDHHAFTTEGSSIFLTPDQATSPSSSPPPPPPLPQVSRPSLLADSPFSWMLGGDDKDGRSGFNAYASFPTPATERNRGRKAGYLFGEDTSSHDGTSGGGGGGPGPKNSFSMASLKGGPTES